MTSDDRTEILVHIETIKSLVLVLKEKDFSRDQRVETVSNIAHACDEIESLINKEFSSAGVVEK